MASVRRGTLQIAILLCTYSTLSPEYKLFKPCNRTVWEMLINFGEKAGIRKKLGWTQDSKMLDRYLHVVDEDVIDETLAKAGSEIIKLRKSVNDTRKSVNDLNRKLSELQKSRKI